MCICYRLLAANRLVRLSWKLGVGCSGRFVDAGSLVWLLFLVLADLPLPRRGHLVGVRESVGSSGFERGACVMWHRPCCLARAGVVIKLIPT